MDKASRAIRRSGVKLMSLGGGHSDLNVLVCDIKDIKNCAKAFMNAQHTAAQDMMRWASHEENRAVKDVVSNIADIFLIWTEVQNTFLSHLKEYRQLFEMILEGEKQVTQAKANLDYCVEKEAKCKKEMKKVGKRASPGEMRILQSRIDQSEQAKDLAQVELSDRVRENEAIKLIRMKEGLLKMSGAYIAMACQCNTLFTAQRNIALQLPDVHGRDLESVKYTGAETTKFIVEKARNKVDSFTSSDVSSDPPPPYTPPDPTTRERSNSSSGIPASQDLERERLSNPRPRYSLNTDVTVSSYASNTSLENEGQPRSRSGSNRSDVIVTTDSSIPYRSGSNSSLTNKGASQTYICSDSDVGQSSRNQSATSGQVSCDPVINNQGLPDPVFSNSTSCESNVVSEQLPPETLVHTNIIKIKHVTSENTSPVNNPPCQENRPDWSVNGKQDSPRIPSENTCNDSNHDNIQFVDEDHTEDSNMSTEARPVPAPRHKTSNIDGNDDYDTTEEDQGANS
ncbi:hypothetical protein ACF0H5_016065 [Mactra antiquata]